MVLSTALASGQRLRRPLNAGNFLTAIQNITLASTLTAGQNITFSRKAENSTLTVSQNITLAKGQNITTFYLPSASPALRQFYLPSASDICLAASVILLRKVLFLPSGEAVVLTTTLASGQRLRRPLNAGNFLTAIQNITLASTLTAGQNITFSRKAENITLTTGQNITLAEGQNITDRRSNARLSLLFQNRLTAGEISPIL